MIISDKNKYLFVELPRTGTTAISKELIENYDGRSILWKHARYHQFEKIASNEQKSYFTFACMRNPVDRTFSLYNKLLTDHRNQYSDYKAKRYTSIQANYFYRQYKFIKDTNASFIDYLQRFYSIPYDDWATLDHAKFDKIIRFENLNEDFISVIKSLGIPVKRELPVVNKTEKDSMMADFSDPETRKILNGVFGVYLSKMGLSLPDGLGKPEVTRYMKTKYAIFHQLRTVYWRYLKRK